MANYVSRATIEPFEFYGLQIRELTPGTLTSASIAEIEVRPAVAHPLARSIKSDKLYTCLEGTVVFHVRGQELKLQYLDTLFIKRNEWFKYFNDSNKVARLLLVHIPPFDLGTEELIA
ncbi:MAG: cupin domain-containing protein [Chloroflexota bacterium]